MANVVGLAPGNSAKNRRAKRRFRRKDVRKAFSKPGIKDSSPARRRHGGDRRSGRGIVFHPHNRQGSRGRRKAGPPSRGGSGSVTTRR